MNNAVFGKTMENVRKHRDIKLVTTERRRNYLASEPNLSYYKVFHRTSISNKNEKKSRNTYEFGYDYVKPKYDINAKLCYMDTDSFIVYIKTDDIYKDIIEDVETRLGTSEIRKALTKMKK